jgi:hypothetical protein
VEILARKASATEAQIMLCQRFQEIMTILADRQYQQAISGFEAILADFPDDGPARFFLNHSQQLASRDDSSDNPLIIKLDSK